MKPKYFLRNEVLHEVHEVLAERVNTLVLSGTMGVVTVRKNGRDGKLFVRRPFGWGNPRELSHTPTRTRTDRGGGK